MIVTNFIIFKILVVSCLHHVVISVQSRAKPRSTFTTDDEDNLVVYSGDNDPSNYSEGVYEDDYIPEENFDDKIDSDKFVIRQDSTTVQPKTTNSAGSMNRGPKGDVGPPGQAGIDGMDGNEGPRGGKGLVGNPGVCYSRLKTDYKPEIDVNLQPCPRGEKGESGTAGLRGVDGKPGINGKNGVDGVNGVHGLPGIDGNNGVNGNDGIDGRDGAPGVNGGIGSRGPRGGKGDTGERGVQGITGAMGTPGMRGLQGEQGVQGTRGVEGIPGRDGMDGLPGLQGIPGLDGMRGALINQKCPLEFADTSVLLASTEKHDAGQLAYTITEEKLFLRTKTAWRYVLLGDELGNESKKPENPEITTEKTTTMKPTTTKQPATTTEKQFQPIKTTDCPTDKTKKLRIYALNSLIAPISLTKSSDLDSMCQNQSADLYKPITREKIKIRCRKIIKRNHGQSSRKTKKSVFRQCMRHKLQKTYLKPPTFKAVVSTHSQFISKLISRSNYKYPICNGDNKMVASSWPDFLEKAKGQGTVEVQAFDKKVYTEKTIVWHGSFSSGTQTESGIQKTAQIWGGHRSPLNQNLDCMQWTGSRNKHGYGLASDFIRYDQNTVSGFLKNPTKRSCSEKGIVYCIQINPEGSKKPHAG